MNGSSTSCESLCTQVAVSMCDNEDVDVADSSSNSGSVLGVCVWMISCSPYNNPVVTPG